MIRQSMGYCSVVGAHYTDDMNKATQQGERDE